MHEQFMWIFLKVPVNENNFEEDVESSTDTDESNSSNRISSHRI